MTRALMKRLNELKLAKSSGCALAIPSFDNSITEEMIDVTR